MAVEDTADPHGGGFRDSPGHRQLLRLAQNQGSAAGKITDGHIAQILQPQGSVCGHAQERIVGKIEAAATGDRNNF